MTQPSAAAAIERYRHCRRPLPPPQPPSTTTAAAGHYRRRRLPPLLTATVAAVGRSRRHHPTLPPPAAIIVIRCRCRRRRSLPTPPSTAAAVVRSHRSRRRPSWSNQGPHGHLGRWWRIWGPEKSRPISPRSLRLTPEPSASTEWPSRRRSARSGGSTPSWRSWRRGWNRSQAWSG